MKYRKRIDFVAAVVIAGFLISACALLETGSSIRPPWWDSPKETETDIVRLNDNPDSWVRYRIRYWLTLTEHEGTTRVFMPLPRAWNTQKDIDLLTLEPEPSDIFTDPVNGNRIAFWEVDLSPGRSQTFTEEFEISIQSERRPLAEEMVGKYDDDDPVLQIYLHPTEFIQSDNPELLAAASEIVGDESNPYRKAKLVFDFVVSHMRGFRDDVNDAASAFASRESECGGYAHLFIALCRGAGVPARPVTGLARLQPGEWRWPEGVGTHVWAEFYLPDYGWIPVDPTHARMNPNDPMGISFADRLVLSKGSDIEMGHGSGSGRKPWFHVPNVNNRQEMKDLRLSVTIVSTD